MQATAIRQEMYEDVVFSTTRKVKVAKRNSTLSYFIGLIVTSMILAFMYIVQYATIVQANISIQEITEKIAILEKENSALKREINNFKSPNNIKKIATIHLGMIPSKEKDIIILNE